jgi:hypothetical protein
VKKSDDSSESDSEASPNEATCGLFELFPMENAASQIGLTEDPKKSDSEREVESLMHALDVAHDSDEEAGGIHPKNRAQEILLPFINSMGFQTVIMFFILLSMVLVSGSAHVRVNFELERALNLSNATNESNAHHESNVHNEAKRVFDEWHEGRIDVMENVLLVVFLVELLLRVLAEQRDFLTGPHRAWNIFESFLLFVGVLNAVFNENLKMFVAMRVARIFRLFRAFRVIRIFRFLRQLRLMLFSVVSCMVSLMWALMLLTFVIFFAALYVMAVEIYYLQEHRDIEIDEKVLNGLNEHWNGLDMAIRSLIYSISGGADWGQLAEPFFLISPVHGIVYTFFVLFITFGLLNILVGVFVQEAGEVSKWDFDLLLHSAQDKTEQTLAALIKLFHRMDKDDKDYLTKQDLVNGVRQGRTRTALHHLEIEIGYADGAALFNLADVQGRGVITKKQFVDVCRGLIGRARPLPVAMVGERSILSMQLLHSIAEAVGAQTHTRAHTFMA